LSGAKPLALLLGVLAGAAALLPTPTRAAVVCTAAQIIADDPTDCPNSAVLPCLIDKNHDVTASPCTFDFGTRAVTIDSTQIDLNSNSVTFIAGSITVSGFLNGRGLGGANETTTGGNITLQASTIINITSGGRLHVHGDVAGGTITLTTTSGSITMSGALKADDNSAGARAGAIHMEAGAGISIPTGSTIDVTGINSTFMPARPKLTLIAHGGDIVSNQSFLLNGGGNADGLLMSASGNITLDASVSVDLGANSADISCNNFTMVGGAYLDLRGTAAAPSNVGGTVTIDALGNVDIQRTSGIAAIDAGGNASSGRIAIDAGGSVNVSGRLDVSGLGADSDAGIITVDAGTTITFGDSSTLSARGTFGQVGGDITLIAGGNVVVGAALVDVDGGDAGSVAIITAGTITMKGVAATGLGTGFVQDFGSGGYLDFTGSAITVNGSIDADGTSDGCGGCIALTATFGAVTVNGSIGADSVSPFEGGPGGGIAINATGTVTIPSGGSLSAIGNGAFGCGGAIDIEGRLGVNLAGTGSLDTSGGGGGGFLCVFSDSDINIAKQVKSAGVAAAGGGGEIQINAGLFAGGNVTISNVVDATGGGCGIEGCGVGGGVSIEGCNVNLTASGGVDTRAPDGTGDITITAREALTIAGSVDSRFTGASGSHGQITFSHRTGIVPSITGSVLPQVPASPPAPANPSIESHATCTGPSTPTADCLSPCPTCGDGILAYPETCDPVVQNPAVGCDGCSKFCRTEVCEDNNVCTTNACDPQLGCYFTLNPPCPTATVTPTFPTFTPTLTRTVTNTRTRTRTLTRTPTISPTRTITETATITPTITLSPTRTPTWTVTLSPTITVTPTITLTLTPTLTHTVTPTPPTLEMRRAVGRPGGRICVAARLNNAGAPLTSTNTVGDFTGAPFTFESVTINPAIGAATEVDKQVSRMTDSGIDTFTIDGTNMVGIPNGDLYTARYGVDVLASGTYNLSQPSPLGTEIIISTCTGDCDGSNSVQVSEVQTCINKFLGAPVCNPASSFTNCPIADVNTDDTVSIGELQQCVLSMLQGCAGS